MELNYRCNYLNKFLYTYLEFKCMSLNKSQNPKKIIIMIYIETICQVTLASKRLQNFLLRNKKKYIYFYVPPARKLVFTLHLRVE